MAWISCILLSIKQKSIIIFLFQCSLTSWNSSKDRIKVKLIIFFIIANFKSSPLHLSKTIRYIFYSFVIHLFSVPLETFYLLKDNVSRPDAYSQTHPLSFWPIDQLSVLTLIKLMSVHGFETLYLIITGYSRLLWIVISSRVIFLRVTNGWIVQVPCL